MKRLSISVAALASLLVGGAPAIGQGATSALKGHNTNAPVTVASDRIEVQDRADRAIFSGNVVATQASMTLSAARVTVAYADTGGIQIQRIDASGGVTVRSPSETARGQYAIYDLNTRLITLLGGVTLTRGESRVQGGRLVLDLDSGRAVMDGGGRTAGAPAGTQTTGGRVTGTFTVPQRRN
ncbi:MAG: Lipopolysaccharide export system protein LptA [uncultured Sphingosinicella sp.]|uniref:Lipopolysaccharide export system protein LptA n=1 Tax=uncultured Sphingosinicella sp. TaxID=478748 RepID=A0A6J4TPP8_9SPHN|nr:LptA/OstA family protein [uncultured Sphingosinicella sp.]CAA9528996.1 MAG: Lipopolysaccharide export system protein LptA [uncultured Sphingosinicella sp.]